MATVENTKPIVDIMVDLLMESIGLKKQTPLFDFIITNKSISIDENIKNVSFSGGVADYIYYDGEIKEIGYVQLMISCRKEYYESFKKIISEIKEQDDYVVCKEITREMCEQ